MIRSKTFFFRELNCCETIKKLVHFKMHLSNPMNKTSRKKMNEVQ
jgi:hypothetical protein